MSYFGTNIKKIRKLKSLSQTDLAAIIALKRGTLGAYEEGRSEPKIETIIKFANYFSISIDDLLQRELTVNELLNFNTNLTTNESKLRKSFPRIPMITKSVISDFLKYYDKKSFIDNMPFVVWPLQNEDKEYRAYQIQDLEMSNHEGGLYPDDIVLLEKADLSNFTEEKLALVVCKEIKFRLVVCKENQVCLRAAHPAIEDVSFSKEEIKEIWIPIGLYQKNRSIGNTKGFQF